MMCAILPLKTFILFQVTTKYRYTCVFVVLSKYSFVYLQFIGLAECMPDLVVSDSSEPGLEVIKLFSCHVFYPAHKCLKANNCCY